jgi:1-acyl-sn-glycerol-3-phosphate acyltransferase
MIDRDAILAEPDHSDRRNAFYWTARVIARLAQRLLATVHVDLDPEIARLRKGGGVALFYVGLHRSLWETSGVLVPLYEAGLPVPYVGMGDNLVHGRVFQAISKRIGTFLIQRPSGRRAMIESGRRLRSDIIGFLVRGMDVLLFPEGSRKAIARHGTYGDFFPAAFEPVLEYERNKSRICAANPGLRPLDLYIVPVNVDYSQVREERELVSAASAKPQTLHVFDSFSMLRSIGDTYITYGPPIRVADRLHLDRKALAAECRARCMDLVRILPVNVASLAMLELDAAGEFSSGALEAAVARNVARLGPHAARFRGFTPADPPAEILRRARRGSRRFDRLAADDLPVYRLYAGYIRHYLG